MNKLRENIEAVHRQLDADLAAGDPKAKAFAGMLRGELNAARKSLNVPPLPPTLDIWIGSGFHAKNTGVLILGESTYGDDPPLTEYISSWCRGCHVDRTFSRIFNAFSGLSASSATASEREAFWASVAFANFVHQPVGPTRTHRPTTKNYREAAVALPTTLQRLKPHLRGVLILGTDQSKYSAPVLRDLGIPFVVSRHPTARGVPTTELQNAWNELQSKIQYG